MASVQVKVTMEDGTGFGLWVKISTTNLNFVQSGTQTVTLSPDDYIATVGGHEPSSSSVTIEFIEAGATLASQSFSSPTFFGYIPFTVN